MRYLVGGDSRDDKSRVVPWAFAEAKARGATAFLFLGDMELTPELDAHFQDELALLDPVPFYPALGNHEVKQLGALSIGASHFARVYRESFLGVPRTPVRSSLPDRVVYSVDLPGALHFIALDNVSHDGFGVDQLAWLERDLDQARSNPATRHIVVGMHKPLAHNGVSTHGMDSDSPQAVWESDSALALFQKSKVELILASHVHRYAHFEQGGIRSYVTGGLGAPLDHVGPEQAFHHLLQLDVADKGIDVEVVKFPGDASFAPAGTRNY